MDKKENVHPNSKTYIADLKTLQEMIKKGFVITKIHRVLKYDKVLNHED